MCRSLVHFWDLKTALRDAVCYLCTADLLSRKQTNLLNDFSSGSMKCRNCLSSFENRKSTRKKNNFMQHSSMFTMFYSHKVWTWYCRVVCRTVRGSEWESYRHWEECADTIPVIVKPCPAPPLHTRLTQPGHFGHIIIIHLLSCLFVHWSTNIRSQEVLKVKLSIAAR